MIGSPEAAAEAPSALEEEEEDDDDDDVDKDEDADEDMDGDEEEAVEEGTDPATRAGRSVVAALGSWSVGGTRLSTSAAKDSAQSRTGSMPFARSFCV